jgi:hypothetical protein|tara:strand:+ start:587 stop:1039 length:453 start_codon:yes stop_codon:yes gene_type:complete
MVIPQQPSFAGGNTPPWANDSQRIDVNLIAMLLWQALLTGTAVCISHQGWYLPDASPPEMGLQYGLICFGFLCIAMVLFQVGGIRDNLAMRAEFAQESRYDKWMRSQMQLQSRRFQKEQMRSDWSNQFSQQTGQQLFGVPNDGSDDEKKE